MSSSTSSSEKDPRAAENAGSLPDAAACLAPRRGTWWRIALTLVACLLAVDVAVREFLLPASRDFVNIHDFPRRAAALSSSTGRKLAVLGNSAVGAGVDPQDLMKTLSDRNVPGLHAEVFPADDSRMVDWYCMIDRYLWQSNPSPDILVLCFFDQQLADGRSSQVGRLAHWFAPCRDWPILFDCCLTATDDRADFLISTAWTSFAVRSRLRERTLEWCVPDYKNYFHELNATQLLQPRSQGMRTPSSKPSHRLLGSLLARAAARRTRLVFVAFPRQPSDDPSSDPLGYPLDEDARRLVRNAGMDFLDLRRVAGLTRDKYVDWIHLAPAGKSIFTRALADRLAVLLGGKKSP